MTLDALLAPVSEAEPAGPDLSYDAERQQIEQAFATSGYSAVLGEDVDWRETIRLIEAQSARTKDVWLATYLARAGTYAGSLETVEAGCRMLAGLFEDYWPTVHPTLEEYGFQGRKGACESLTRFAEFLGPLQKTVLIAHPRHGSYSGDDFIRFARDQEAADGFGMFRAALAATSLDEIVAVVERLDAIEDALRRADAVMSERAAEYDDLGTNFAPTLDAVAAIRRVVAPYTGASVEAAEPATDVPGPSSAETPAPRREASGRIENREDVMRALDAIGDYYQRCEPSSPIPIALRRVRGWIAMDFIAVLKDIAPNSVSDVGAVLLTRTTEDGGGNW